MGDGSLSMHPSYGDTFLKIAKRDLQLGTATDTDEAIERVAPSGRRRAGFLGPQNELPIRGSTPVRAPEFGKKRNARNPSKRPYLFMSAG